MTTGRDPEVTRLAILTAALDLFAGNAFDSVTLRQIGSRANVDPSLVNRYFGGKDALFIAVVKAGETDWRALRGGPEDFFDRVIEELVRGPQRGRLLKGLFVILKSAGSEKARRLIDQALGSPLFASLETWIGGRDADVRSRLMFAILAGMVFTKELGGDADMPGERLDILDRQFAGLVHDILQGSHFGSSKGGHALPD